MGEYTSNNHFYLPALGASGEAEKALFDGALESADTTLESLQSQINSVEVGSGSSAPILGVTDGYEKDANLATALATIGSTEITLACPAGAITINNNTTIPANVHLRMEKGAYFNISDTKTLTINGTIEAGPYQIFAWTGTGKVAFGDGAVNDAYIRWWGAVGDGVTDDTDAVQKAINDSYDGLFLAGNCNLKGSIGDTYLVNPLVCAASGGIFLNKEFSDFSLKVNPANYGIDISFPYTDIDTTENTITYVGHGLVEDDCIVVTSSSGHDSQFGIKDSKYTTWTHHSHNSTFWVHYVSDDVIQLRSLPSQYGSGVCDITSQGSGTHTISKSTAALHLLYSTYRVNSFTITGYKPSGGYVWVTSAVTSEPSALTITGLTPVKRTSYATLAAAGNWYYNDVSKKLYIVLNSATDLPKTTYTNITADAQEIVDSELEPYFGHGAGISVGRQSNSNLISDGTILYMDKALEYRFVYRTVTERILTNNCYYSVFGDYDQDMNKANTFRNIHCAVCWGPAAFYWGAGESNLFEFLEVDLYRKKIFHATGGTNIALTIRQVYDEGQAGQNADWANNDNTSVFTFEDCTAVTLENVESYLGALTSTSVTTYFELINSSLKVSGGKIYMMDVTWGNIHYQSIYSCDATSNIIFIGGSYGNGIKSREGTPCHQQSYVLGGATLISASNVVLRPNYAQPNMVATAGYFNFSDITSLTVATANGGAFAQDTGTGYNDSYSGKFTFATQDTGNVRLHNIFSAGSGTKYGCFSCFIKADADQTFYVSNSGTSGGNFFIKGDEVWRHYSFAGPAVNSATYTWVWIYRVEGAADANIWIDCPSQRWFDSKQEADSWLCSVGLEIA